MSNLNQFIGDPAVSSIVGGFSNGAAATAMGIYDDGKTTKTALSGALTANTLATVLSVTGGGGYLDFLAMKSVDATSRTHRIKITLDGTVVLDGTGAAIAVANYGHVVVGGAVFAGNAVYASAKSVQPIPLPHRFNSSCLIEYASSLTETDKTLFLYAYRLTN